MGNIKKINQSVEIFKEVQRPSEQKSIRIEPVARQVTASDIQDLDFNKIEYPQKAEENKNDDEMNGVYDDLIRVAADLAKEYHKGQVDKQGVDYFEGHLTTVGNAGYNWKEKIVGFLHDVAEDTPHTVDEIVLTLKNKSNGVLKYQDEREIHEALTLLNARTASTREEYIAKIKESFIATKVKLNDLKHNMDMSRISNPTDGDTERTKRYRREYRQVLEYFTVQP